MSMGRPRTPDTGHRLVCVLDLIDDPILIAAYDARHAAGAVWPEIVADLHQRGYRDLEIWRARERLVMVAEVGDDFPRPGARRLQPAVARWEAEMDAYQSPLVTDGPKWLPMTRVFTLEDQHTQ